VGCSMGDDLKAHVRLARCSWAVLVWGSIAQGQLHPLYVPPISEAALQQAADPIPIQRVLVAPNRVAAELQRARQRVIRQMPRAEFECLVRRAARTSRAANEFPRLLEARYRGSLEDGAIVGTSEWIVENPPGSTGVLPLPSFNLALRQAQLGNSGAIIGDWDGKTAGLLIAQPGKHVVSMVWSVRSDSGPSGLRFEIKLPPCVLSSFDLDLPAGRSLTVSGETCLLSARPADSMAPRRQWRIPRAGASP